ncbi:ImmA/IrrE family metallo-endopeptidase [Clostridium botulinum D/C]|uniref:DNA-binding protein n=1 Tax=Clostridium botulinum C/D str. DC5 TaxID=1443128 RepID=A0A0A0IHB6_CLOBO|nr:DNA-binding protein [Clostridium botulinum C/D str. DC5]MCD3234597.1 ImmA/IrrE family metallo-endopeptidase [Clostridium botulinum D/C]MCD3239740.1 ImmA/IrrE family metallo-endopeptidase [Clostridium botulinum D/C]MCD3268002.1 ImmA/IrrE family metallo-endopeptidase [Clostridium botulinum D/C]MCD3299063.1 ImmA/IrrE family metallo-endopeptidase [Clostridium botulinum D/C]
MIKNKKFNGKRLQIARIYRGKTIVELAKDIGVSKQAISQFENGLTSPQFDTLMNIVDTLKFPREYFFQEDKIDIRLGNTYFRAHAKMTKKDENKQKEKVKFIGKLYNFLNEYIEFPELNIPEFEEKMSIEDKAIKLREYWELGEEPVKDIVYILEKNGIIVTSMNMESEEIDAFTQQQIIDNKKNFIIVLGSDKGSATRRQFSAAHELAHIIMHDGFINLEELTNEEIRNMENDAHTFAAAFLLPRNAFIKDVSLYPTNLEYYKQLKKKWRTSISAMLVRANHLGVLSYNSYQNMMKKMSKLGWRKEEPLDDSLIMSKPTVLKRAVNILIDNDILNPNEILMELSNRELSLPAEEIENLLGLDKGTLTLKHDEISNKIIEISVKK